ncbi:MAG: DUF6503 family protein [Bacteroidota bacterium]
MYRYLLPITALLSALFACQPTPSTSSAQAPAPASSFQNKAHQLVANSVEKVGTYDRLLALKDVSYTYTYRLPDGRQDVTEEQYIFDGERSKAKFIQHDVSFVKTEGTIVQGFDGAQAWTSIDGERTEDSAMIERAFFLRKTNFYWFAMNQKLLDPGLSYQYIRLDTVNNQTYDVVEVSFGEGVGEAQDLYHLYINQKTGLIDQFLFTVMAFERSEPLLMEVTYEAIDGILLPVYRRYTPANWEGVIIKEDSWAEEISQNIRFNTGLDQALFQSPA